MTLPTQDQLPGIDPKFHEVRKYLAPVRYKDKRILASFGSCKEPGCNFSEGWTTNVGRDLGMWKHRAGEVRKARLKLFKKISQGDHRKAADMLLETADKHSHTFENWVGIVEGFIRNLAGIDLNDLPDYRYRTEYHIGTSALTAAEQAIDQDYEI